MNPAERARADLRETFQNVAIVRVALAPGRVNLIGEHTDYNDGFVLPMAIDRGIAVAFAVRSDRAVRAYATAFGQTREVSLDALDEVRGAHWFAYVAGVARALLRNHVPIPGLDLAVAGNLPIGAGLSSSAAFAMAVARALCAAARVEWQPEVMARHAQDAENQFVGVACGIMDPFVAGMARENCALLLDCRSLENQPVPIPEHMRFVVMDTGLRRDLASSAYNERRAACERAVAALHAHMPAVHALRDVDQAMLERGRDHMDGVAFQRAQHVVSEIPRPRAMADALVADDLHGAGQLMNESHASLRDLYEVSCAELDTMVEEARAHDACYGARMTGAGFGGCAIALVAEAGATDFCKRVSARYLQRTGHAGSLFVVRPSAGARLID